MATTKAVLLAQDLVDRFEDRISRGDMPPGSRFPTEREVTDDFGVSRTVVREAFARLSARGLLVSRRGAGAFVADHAQYRAFQVAPEEVAEIADLLKLLEMRRGFEMEMAELAAQRRGDTDLADMEQALDLMEHSTDVDSSVQADTLFHAAIARATRNDYFVRFTDFLGVRLVPSRRLYLQGSEPKVHQSYARMINRDHRAIYDAILAQNPVAARRAACRHIDKSIDRYAARIEAA